MKTTVVETLASLIHVYSTERSLRNITLYLTYHMLFITLWLCTS